MSAPDPPTTPLGEWEGHAAWWQERFTAGVDPEYEEQLVPLVVEWLAGYGRVLDLGAGEGQISRALVEAGAEVVVALDPVQAQIAEAQRRGGGVLAVRAGADALALADDSVDAALVCLVLEHVDDLSTTLSEVARVVRPGGRFLLLLNHPLLSAPGSAWVDDHLVDPPEQYWQLGPYLPGSITWEEVEPGVHVRFVHRPLNEYVNGLVDVGFCVERMLEPPPPPGFVDRSVGYQAAVTIPRLMALVAKRS